MGDFPDAYTIYTAIREQCRIPHHQISDQSALYVSQHLLNRNVPLSQPLAHTLKFGFSEYAGFISYEEGTSERMTR